MKKPETLTGCPFCNYEGELELNQKTFTHAMIKGVKKGKWWRYECPECELSFSTTESDKLSIEQWHEKK